MPYSTSVHAYADDTPFDDDDRYPIMIYMGFSNKDGTLLYTTPDDTARHLGFCFRRTTSLLNQVTDAFTSIVLLCLTTKLQSLLTVHAHFTYNLQIIFVLCFWSQYCILY